MKCKECADKGTEREAEWLVIDQIPYEDLFLPLCGECFHELKEMEGEMNLDFELIENMDLEDIVRRVNEKWKFLVQKYKNTLQLVKEQKEKGRCEMSSKRLDFRLSRELKEKLRSQSEASGKTMTRIIRDWIRNPP